jgi:predicted AAA+ superfamily ATPase
MPHSRARYFEPMLLQAIKFSSIVGVLGQRQTGKTTLLSRHAKAYVTLDLTNELETANQDPLSYLSERARPFAIDECQLSPALFPALKEWVRVHPQKGQFILSGSVRFTSRKQIKESLSGRITTLELLPFTLSECHSKPLIDPTQIENYLKAPRFTRAEQERFLNHGGLPGICFRRNQKLINQGFEDQVITLLDRDLRLLVETKLALSSLRNLLTMLAQQAGKPLDISQLARLTRISRPTIRNLIAAFEAMFLIRILSSEGGVTTPTLFFEDVGMLNYLTQNRLPEPIQKLNAFYQCIRAPYFYSREKNFRFFEYQTRGGAFVPLALQLKNKTVGWIFTDHAQADRSTLESANSFLRAYSDAHVFILGAKIKSQKLSAKITTGSDLGGL